ncbi:hypothetical protein [Ruminococcus albus]|uniref:hypothetical protein n=1 Tax=Ruminococcus albus TaxID=1264 RepID=UPI0018AD46BC|nr:hypothetical protein [Ruminococcus albus]
MRKVKREKWKRIPRRRALAFYPHYSYVISMPIIVNHGYPFNTPQIIYNAVQINRPQKPENIV